MESIESLQLQRWHRNEHAQGRPPLRRHGFIKSCCWRGERLHHGGGVCLLFVQMCRLVWSSSLVVCRQVPQDNLKVGLKKLRCAPPKLAPHPRILAFKPPVPVLNWLDCQVYSGVPLSGIPLFDSNSAYLFSHALPIFAQFFCTTQSESFNLCSLHTVLPSFSSIPSRVWCTPGWGKNS